MTLPFQEYENENGASKESDGYFVHRVVGSSLPTYQTARGRGLAEKRRTGLLSAASVGEAGLS